MSGGIPISKGEEGGNPVTFYLQVITDTHVLPTSIVYSFTRHKKANALSYASLAPHIYFYMPGLMWGADISLFASGLFLPCITKLNGLPEMYYFGRIYESLSE
jgi:hypothetical protein